MLKGKKFDAFTLMCLREVYIQKLCIYIQRFGMHIQRLCICIQRLWMETSYALANFFLYKNKLLSLQE